jgi:hypothetical protein
VAEAIGDPKSTLASLAMNETDERKLIEEIFLRVLSRPATEQEISRTAEAWKKIAQENEQLHKEAAAKEAEQAPLIAKADAERSRAIELAKEELSRYEAEIAPQVARAEAERAAKEVTTAEAVKAWEQEKAADALAAWEAGLPAERKNTGWVLFDKEIKTTETNALAKLQVQEGGIIYNPVVSANPYDYIINLRFDESDITGLMLEVLPDPTLPNCGPGLASDGNFNLTEIYGEWIGGRGPTLTALNFSDAVADFSAAKSNVKAAINGKKEKDDPGWSVTGAPSQAHFAAFTLKTPIGAGKDTKIILRMTMRRNSLGIGKFRLWYTKDRTVGLGLPANVIAALAVPVAERTKAQTATLLKYHRQYHPEIVNLDLAYGVAKLPLPTDAGVVQRRALLAKAEEPIRLDPKLVQLRQDIQQSKLQLANQRLTGAQDLVWALVNNPAFLFNY